MITAVTDATFDALVLRAERPVLLEFTASWCPPCRMIEPVLREIATEQEGRLVVAQLDVDANPRTARDAGVLGMPTLSLYVGGAVVGAKAEGRPAAGDRAAPACGQLRHTRTDRTDVRVTWKAWAGTTRTSRGRCWRRRWPGARATARA